MKICYNCFHTAGDSFRFCEKCGSPLDTQNSADWPEALECGTTLYGRYLIGNVLQQDDSSITYSAQDSRTKGRVAVREYFPRTYCSRTSMRTVSASEEHRDEYLEGKDLFLQNAEALADENESDQPPCVQSYFNQNDTAYLVVDYGSPDHLKEFLDGKGFRTSGPELARDSAGRPSPTASPAASHAASPVGKDTPPSAGKSIGNGKSAGYSERKDPPPFQETGVHSESENNSPPLDGSNPQHSLGDQEQYLTDAVPAPTAMDPSLPQGAVQKAPLPADSPGTPGGGGYFPGSLPGENINVPHRNPVSSPGSNAGPGPGSSPGLGQGSSPGAGQNPSTGMGTGSGRKGSLLPIAFIIGILALCLVTVMLLIPRIARGSRDLRYFIYSIQRQIHRKREFFERRSSEPDDSSDGNGSGIEDIFDGNGSENGGAKEDSPVKDPFEDLLKDDRISDEGSAEGISSGNFYNKGYYALAGDECFYSDAHGFYRSSYDNIGSPEKINFEAACYINPYGGRIYYLNDIDNKIRCFDPESGAAFDIYDYEGEQGFKPESVCINEGWCYFSCKNKLYRFSMEEVSSQTPLHPQDVETVLEDFNADNHIFPSLCFVDGCLVYNGQEGTVAVGPDGSRKTLSSRKGRLFSSGSDLYFKYGINEIYRLSLDGESTQLINAESGSFITTASCIGGWIYYALETEENIELWRLSSDGAQNEYIADLGSKGDILASLCVFKAPDEEGAGNESAFACVYLLSKTEPRLTPVHETFFVD